MKIARYLLGGILGIILGTALLHSFAPSLYAPLEALAQDALIPLSQPVKSPALVEIEPPRGVDFKRLEKYNIGVNGELVVRSSGRSISKYRFLTSSGVNGRGLTIYGENAARPVRGTKITDVMILADGDDGFNAWNYTRGTVVNNCYFTDIQAGNGRRSQQTKACLIGSENALPAPDYLDWISFDHVTFSAYARAPDQRGGVARYTYCVFRPSARNVWTQAKANIDHCDFFTSSKPADAAWWDEGDPITLKEPVPDGIYIDVATCRLNGNPIKSPNDIFRMYAPKDGGQSGDIDAPAKTFRTTPWPTK